MAKTRFAFSNSTTEIYFNAKFSQLKSIAPARQTVLITDENVYRSHKNIFKGWKTITIKAGEKYKTQSTIDTIIARLIELEVDRSWMIVGVGGGVVTDLSGYVASIFLRGIKFGFVPTSLLAMVDASIGGKNGIDVGVYKNMVGTIRQPAFILYDAGLLKTLPQKEWRNGFAEIIKHACIRDRKMFRELQAHDLTFYQQNKNALSDLIQRNAKLKLRIVQEDEFEMADRKLLNFGHTLGHAIENDLKLMHGHAVAIGMVAACRFSEILSGFKSTTEVELLLKKYELPVRINFDKQKVFRVMSSDKKRAGSEINYVLLDKIGNAFARKIQLKELKKLIDTL